MAKPLFITLEGIDGSGKSTQIQLLLDFLDKKGIPYVYTREPGGTPMAEQIRRMILSAENREMEAITEVLLFAAARAENVAKVIRPALAAGKHVICDRYIDSSLVYQGGAGKVPEDVVFQINRLATGDLMPDLTILYDLPAEAALVRRVRRQAQKADDRIEAKGLAFQQKVREGYLALAERFPQRFVCIDATQSVEAMHVQTRQVVWERITAGDTGART